jgi:hypothetical protein
MRTITSNSTGSTTLAPDSDRLIIEFTASNGVPYFVRLVPSGGCYGRNEDYINASGDYIIEFFDTRWANRNGHGPQGQYVAPYKLSDLYDHPLCEDLLMGPSINWRLSADDLQSLLDSSERTCHLSVQKHGPKLR